MAFDVNFLGATGVAGKMTFDFTKSQSVPGEYEMAVGIFNNTPTLGGTTGVITGFAISLPPQTQTTADDTTTDGGFQFLAYNPKKSPFVEVEPGGTATADQYFDLTPYTSNANLGGVGTFDFCFVGSQNCNGAGSGNVGVKPPNGQTAVSFKIQSSLASANLVSQYFQQYIYNTQNSCSNNQPCPIATRWQSITGSLNGSTSDKVVGQTVCKNGICTGPGPAPGDAVPGPLPLFGAAAAFGYSRKLRHRISATRAQPSLES
ncbi:hypothetical protein [Synechococcus sp. CCY 0621]|uniref:hypothetical protein n=1 Tax=Synechococcus sp. CCY 0621 TaxID=2815603 RepID=UPI001C216F6A|nr:hypothetical protein [Synechococcus sp. CCY 0621]